MIRHAIALVKKYATPTLRRYLLVGGFGCAVDAGVMELLVHLATLNPLLARVISMAASIVCTYLPHRFFTFSDSKGPMSAHAQFAAFGAVQAAAAGLNYVSFAATLWLLPRPLPLVPAFIERDFANLFSLGIGVFMGLVFNYAVLRYVIFPKHKEQKP